MLPVKADLAICSPVIGVPQSVAFMLSYKLNFCSSIIMPGFGKSSHKWLLFPVLYVLCAVAIMICVLTGEPTAFLRCLIHT